MENGIKQKLEVRCKIRNIRMADFVLHTLYFVLAIFDLP